MGRRCGAEPTDELYRGNIIAFFGEEVSHSAFRAPTAPTSCWSSELSAFIEAVKSLQTAADRRRPCAILAMVTARSRVPPITWARQPVTGPERLAAFSTTTGVDSKDGVWTDRNVRAERRQALMEGWESSRTLPMGSFVVTVHMGGWSSATARSALARLLPVEPAARRLS